MRATRRSRRGRRFLIATLAAASLVATAGCRPQMTWEEFNPFIGAWRLASWESRAEDGTVTQPYGGRAEGQIVYTASLGMSAQLMQAGRELPDSDEASAAEMRDAILGGFFSYYGSYLINEGHLNPSGELVSGEITHFVEGALLPAWVGSERPRAFTFEGRDRLILSTEPDPARGPAVGTLVWERIPNPMEASEQ